MAQVVEDISTPPGKGDIPKLERFDMTDQFWRLVPEAIEKWPNGKRTEPDRTFVVCMKESPELVGNALADVWQKCEGSDTC